MRSMLPELGGRRPDGPRAHGPGYPARTSAVRASGCIGSPSCQGPVPALRTSRWSAKRGPVREVGGCGQRPGDHLGHGGAADVAGTDEDDAVGPVAIGAGGDDEAAGARCARIPCAHCGRVLVAQRLLDDLAGPGPGPLGAELELLGDLLGHEPGLAAERDHVGQLEPAGSLGQLHDGADPLAPLGVGQPDDRDLDHLRGGCRAGPRSPWR